MDVTVTHNGLGESLTFPVMEESGSPLFSVDIGKPELQIWPNGELQPRFNDTRSLIENYSITSQLTGENAYANAIQLADIIKSRTGDGGTLTVELSGTNIPDAYPTSPTTVAPAAEQERAVELTYSPGRKNVVDVEGQFTKVGNVNGNANQEATTPTETPGFGETAGPITISGGGTTVELFEDVNITRTVGRPNSTIRGTTRNYPNYTDHRKTAYDAFDIAFQLYENGPAKVVDLANEILGTPLGRDSLTLDFQGLFGLGSFDVIPDGSQAFRYQRVAGQKDVENAPTLSLRRVI
jgi:hypothetical protein